MFVEQARLFVDFCFFPHRECGRPTSAHGWYIMHVLHQTPGRRTHHLTTLYVHTQIAYLE